MNRREFLKGSAAVFAAAALPAVLPARESAKPTMTLALYAQKHHPDKWRMIVEYMGQCNAALQDIVWIPVNRGNA